MKSILKYFLFAIGCCLLSCDGADYEDANPKYCYFIPETIEVFGAEPGAECDARFLIIDDQGEEYSFDFQVNGSLPLIGLPKERCYSGWILDEGSGHCGNVTYTFGYEENQCVELVTSHDTRGDAYTYNAPDYEFCLGAECSCPSITINAPTYEQCSIPYTQESVAHFCFFHTQLDKEALFDYYEQGWTLAPGLNLETCGKLEYITVVFENDGDHYCSTASGHPDFDTTSCPLPCGTSVVYLAYHTELCGEIEACHTELYCGC